MGTVVPCDVHCLRADAATVNALARLQLHAGRSGLRVSLRNASPELLELIAFMGLTRVFLRLEPCREAEERE
jgi:STAS domain-containing protein